ncbi:unnamed protein product [Chrysoparadoxa australica]
MPLGILTPSARKKAIKVGGGAFVWEYEGIPTPGITPHKAPCFTFDEEACRASEKQEKAQAMVSDSYRGAGGRKVSPSWFATLQGFVDAKAVNEVMQALDVIAEELEGMPVSALSDCKAQLDAIVDLKRGTSDVMVPAITRAIINLEKEFFAPLAFISVLPDHVLQRIMSFFSMADKGTATSVSQSWSKLSSENILWRGPYLDRFSTHTPEVRQAGSHSLTHSLTHHDTLFSPQCELAGPAPMKTLYAQRLEAPQNGDKVQVAWKGKFRLESLEIYNGLAWWVAEVVGQDPEKPGMYKVHYPGWESRWDEWVPRRRLRWGNTAAAVRLKGQEAQVNDTVEIWCGGVNVPGAWLEATVMGVRGDELYLGEVLTNEEMWTNRNRCCLVKKGEAMAPSGADGMNVCEVISKTLCTASCAIM